MVKTIQVVDAVVFPNDVEEYCVEKDISTHYQNDIVFVEDDGNALAEWLKSQGVIFEGGEVWIGIFAT